MINEKRTNKPSIFGKLQLKKVNKGVEKMKKVNVISKYIEY